jgi:Tfp pilus assembly protein PilN
MKTIRLALLAAALAVLGGVLVLTQSGQDLFQQALVKEQADGDLRGALVIYQRIVRDFTADRTLTAKSLVQMGRCYDRLGQAEASEARKAYERVVREFADQKDAVEQARALLAAGSLERTPDVGIAVQLKRVLPAGRRTTMSHVSPDGRFITFIDAHGNVWLHDLTTG